MKSMIIGAAGILVTAGALPAFAADMSVAEPPVEAPPITEVAGVYDWGGFYVGANTGYAWTNAEYSGGGATLADRDLNGWAVGAYAGYNFFNNGWVYGVEADVKRDFNDERFDAGGTSFKTETTWGGSVRARLGYAIDRTLIYGTGGYAFTNAKLENLNTGASEKETLHGWTIGAGVEQAFTDSVTGRIEYRYSDYGKSDVFNTPGLDADVKSHAVMVGVSMKF